MMPFPARNAIFGKEPARIPVGRYCRGSSPGIFPADVKPDIAFVGGNQLVSDFYIAQPDVVGK